MKLKAEIRNRKGKGGARRVRAEGKVPAIIYGRGEAPLLLQIDEKPAKLLNRGEHLSLELDKSMERSSPLDVIIKEIQLEPTTSRVMHIDFQRLHRDEKLKVKVRTVLEGTEIVAKSGGILEHLLPEVEVECLPKDIPEEIKVDVSTVKIGESVHLRDLPPIKGKFITPMDATVVAVVAPKVVEEKPLPKEEVVEGEKVKETKEEKKEGNERDKN